MKNGHQFVNLTSFPNTSKSSRFVKDTYFQLSSRFWKCGGTWSFVLHVLNKCLILVFIPLVPTRPNQIHFHRSTTQEFFHFQKRRLFHRVKARRRPKEDQGGWEWSQPQAEHEVCSIATNCAETKISGRPRIKTNHVEQLEIETLWWLISTPTWQIGYTEISSQNIVT